MSLGVCGGALSQAGRTWSKESQSPLCVEGRHPGGESRHLAEKGANANPRYSSQEMPSISQAESVPAMRCLSRALAQEDGEATLTVPA